MGEHARLSQVIRPRQGMPKTAIRARRSCRWCPMCACNRRIYCGAPFEGPHRMYTASNSAAASW